MEAIVQPASTQVGDGLDSYHVEILVLMNAVKKPTTVDEQLELLRSRSMEIGEPLARQWLTNVSYYRLSGYWYAYRVLPTPDDPKNPVRLDQFENGTRFTDIAALYEFDRKMRTLIYDGIERIEVAMRAKLGELLVAKGALSYQDASLFRPGFDHAGWLETAYKRVERARGRDRAIDHYATHYDDYPFWVLADVLDFSDISQLFDGLVVEDQRTIAHSFGLVADPGRLNSKQKKSYYTQDPLARWCEQLSVLRNTCAHHGRVWNRHFTPASSNALRTIPDLHSLPKGQSERLYGALLVMAFMLKTVSPGSSWSRRVRTLIDTEYVPLPMRHLNEMGIPHNWHELTLWAV